MAVSCTASELADNARCFACLSSRQLAGIQILLLCAAVNGETMSCDPYTLLELATDAQYTNIPSIQQMAVQTYLLCQLTNSGGGGGGGATQVFAADYGGVAPTTTPTTTSAIAVDTGTGTVWYWYSSAWH